MASRGEIRGFTLSQAWRPMCGIGWIGAALLLMLSWWPLLSWPPFLQSRSLWNALDARIYFALNGTVAWHDAVAAFWAVTGDRVFDVVSALVLLVLYLVAISRDGLERFRAGLAMGFVTLIVLLAVLLVQRQVIALERLAPSHVLQPFHSLADVVAWSNAKEGSNRSFPGDHASVMMILTVLWWRSEGRRVGLVMLALTVLFTLPRLAAGAHWATDVLVGGGVATFVTLALVTATPLPSWLYRPARRATDAVVDNGLAIYRRMTPA